jgi:hypothetical protein
MFFTAVYVLLHVTVGGEEGAYGSIVVKELGYKPEGSSPDGVKF